MVEISVIIPVFNVEDFLEECLNSVCNQTFQDIEIICVNDGSTDNSLHILENFASMDSRIKIISQENSGPGYARGIGLSHALGKFIIFLDSDDFLELNTLELLYNNIVSNESDVVMFKIIRYNHVTSEKLYNNPAFDFDTIFDVDFNNFTFSYGDVRDYVLNRSYSPVSKFYRKDFLTSYDDFFFSSNIRYEDVPFHIQVMLRAKLSFCPYFLYNYRISNNSSIINTSDSEKVMDIFNIIDIVEKILKDECFFDEFIVEFHKFKFEQILAYLLPSKSDKYFSHAKQNLNNLSMDFYCNDYNKCQFDALVNSSNFNEFQTKLINELKSKIFSLNNEINRKNSVINSKEDCLLNKEKEINNIRGVMELKNKNIIERDLEINEKQELLDLKDQYLVEKEKNIIKLQKLIDSKDELLIEKEKDILEKQKQLVFKDNHIVKKEREILEKQRIIDLKCVQIDSSLINKDSIFSKTSEVLNVIFNDKGEKINHSNNWTHLGKVTEDGINQSNTSDIIINNEIFIFEKPFHIEFDVINVEHPHAVRFRIFTKDDTVSARTLKQLDVIKGGHISIDILDDYVIWCVNGVKKASQNITFDSLIRMGWFILKEGANVTYKNFRIYTL